MTTYVVEFSYSVPEWGTVSVENASDDSEAANLARQQIDMLYPEATDVVIETVSILEDIERE